MIRLFRRNEKGADYDYVAEAMIPYGDESLDAQKQKLLDYVAANSRITRREAERVLGSGSTKAFRLLRELCESGQLKTQGSGRLSCYVLK